MEFCTSQDFQFGRFTKDVSETCQKSKRTCGVCEACGECRVCSNFCLNSLDMQIGDVLVVITVVTAQSLRYDDGNGKYNATIQ